jgi:hypothetical protein
VTTVTAIGDATCYATDKEGEAVVTSIQMWDSWCSALPIDDRNERPLLIALVAIAIAWSIPFFLGL